MCLEKRVFGDLQGEGRQGMTLPRLELSHASTQEGWGTAEAVGGLGGVSPVACRGNAVLPTPGFQTFGLGDSLCLAHCLWNRYGSCS